jgi:hypothetical protein
LPLSPSPLSNRPQTIRPAIHWQAAKGLKT